MDRNELEGHAERIAAEILDEVDRDRVSEDSLLWDASPDDIREIHNLITNDVFTVMYP